jgi:hypothetical protein
MNLSLVIVLCTTFPNGGLPITSCQTLPAANFGAYDEAHCIAAARKYGADMQKTNQNARFEAHCAIPTPPYQAID